MYCLSQIWLLLGNISQIIRQSRGSQPTHRRVEHFAQFVFFPPFLDFPKHANIRQSLGLFFLTVFSEISIFASKWAFRAKFAHPSEIAWHFDSSREKWVFQFVKNGHFWGGKLAFFCKCQMKNKTKKWGKNEHLITKKMWCLLIPKSKNRMVD